MIIYKAVNKINGKIYVGQTVMALERRIAAHLCAKTGIFPAALRKYGIQSFEFSVIDASETQASLKEKEVYWIKFYGCKVPKGYNITDGGNGGMLGYKASDETRKKQSESSKGKNKGAKNGMFGKPGIMRGKQHRKESKVKDSESKKKNWEDPEYREKIAAARKSKRYSESMSAARSCLWQNLEYRARQIEAHKGHRNSEEAYKKTAEGTKSHWQDPEWRMKRLLQMQEMRNSPEYKEKLFAGIKKATKRFYDNPENRQKKIDSTKRGWLKRKEAITH